jgi:hypothetical protein
LKVRIVAASSADAIGEVECFPGHFVFVHGEDEVRVLLAGQGGARGTGGVKLKIGGNVGIRAPMWDVDVGGETWVVGVDWVVLWRLQIETIYEEGQREEIRDMSMDF